MLAQSYFMAELVWAHDFAVLMWSNSPVVSRSLSQIWGFAFPLAQWIQTALLPLDAPLSNFTSKVPVYMFYSPGKTWAENVLQTDISSSVIPMPLGYIDFPKCWYRFGPMIFATVAGPQPWGWPSIRPRICRLQMSMGKPIPTARCSW